MSNLKQFYLDWLQRNQIENDSLNQRGGDHTSTNASPSLSETERRNSTASSRTPSPVLLAAQTPEEVVFENSALKLFVTKSSFKRQKNFRLSDHLYKLRVSLKDKSGHFPKLIDSLDFLHAGLIHILDEIKHFYEKNDHNIVYLTVHQNSFLNGLNSGNFFIIFNDYSKE